MGPVRQNPIQRTVSLFICVCIALCTIVAHNIAQNRPDSFPPYPPEDHHSSDDVYLREGGASAEINNKQNDTDIKQTTEAGAQWGTKCLSVLAACTTIRKTDGQPGLFLLPSRARMLEKPAIERVQALADISRSALYAFAVSKAVSLHTCVLSYQRNPCTDCKSAQ